MLAGCIDTDSQVILFVIPSILAATGLSFVGEHYTLPTVSLLLVILGGPR